MPAPSDRRLDPRYEIQRFAGSAIGDRDVVALWTSEGALPPEVAEKRVREVLLVAVEVETGAVAGICTTYLTHYERLRMDLWYYRTYVGAAHREADIARHLLHEAIDHLQERFVSGADRSAAGIVVEVQSPLVKRQENRAVWPALGFPFIGSNARGDHLRVLYFPGAKAPPPEGTRSYT